MATVPAAAAAAATVKRFDGIINPADVVFTNDAKQTIYPWKGKDGKPSGQGSTQTIGHAIIHLGKSGLTIPCRMVVTRQPDTDPALKLELPSSGTGVFKSACLKGETDKVDADLAIILKDITERFVGWRKANKPSNRGSVSAARTTGGVKADLDSLGLD